ncbi:SRPBCC family protein [Streptomyces sp. NPDC003077]|uniref:SRPBCC family protein n=1 Tax=Streptomyces sp. NPDC003077 TaxID=3154443 RepID=UPI0033AEACA6
MSGHRRATRARLLGTVALGAAGYGTLVRPRLLTWGATAAEAARAYPGDELVPGGRPTTMATTLPAPPERVWPWLAQMGCDRGGWYSWDRLDNGGRPSARRIVPEWQELKEGQRLHAVPGGGTWFTVALLEPRRTLVLRMDVELPSGRPFEVRTGPLPGAYLDAVWGFHLSPDPGGGTRLVVRTRGRSRPRLLLRPVDLLFGEPAHFVMQLRQFRNLRARVGTTEE